MLDLSNEAAIDQAWEHLESKAVLPTSAEEFYKKSGAKADRQIREFERHYLRCRSIFRYECQNHGAYMKDCSRAGMGFLSPIQLFPRDPIQLWISNQRNYSLEIIRCQRLMSNCYECGAIFILK